MQTPRQGRGAADQHVVKLDQVPRWNEQDPAIGPDTFRGANGLQEGLEERSGSTRYASSTTTLPDSAVPLKASPSIPEGVLDPLKSTESLRNTRSTSDAVPASSGDTDVLRTLSSFNDPLTLRSKKPKAGTSQDAVSKFPAHLEVNSKVFLWRGDPWNLEVDVVVNCTNETLDMSASSPGLHSEAGPGLAEECAALGGCRTGEVKVSGAYALPARHVFHTVGPRYSPKYQTAAENALSGCYRTCLELLVELGLHSIALGCLYSEAKGYPREQAAHVAIRTVRRFLEKHGQKLQAVVFCIQSHQDNEIYRRLLPLYFPRDKAEEDAASHILPDDTGDEVGGASSQDRSIRIHATVPTTTLTPTSSCSSVRNGGSWMEPLDALVGKEFLEVLADPDARRKEQWAKSAAAQSAAFTVAHWVGLDHLTGPPLTLGEEFVLHQRYLNHAKKLDFTQLQEMKIVCRGGVDVAGRQVIAIVGAHFLPRCIDVDSFVLYVVKELDSVMHRPFCVVYYHAAVHLSPLPNFAWMAKLHHILGPRHRRNLQVIYAVHPTLGLRTAIWAMQALVDPMVWKRVQYITRLVDLFHFVPRGQVTVPEFVIMHDIELNPMDAITISYQAHASRQPGGLLLSRDF